MYGQCSCYARAVDGRMARSLASCKGCALCQVHPASLLATPLRSSLVRFARDPHDGPSDSCRSIASPSTLPHHLDLSISASPCLLLLDVAFDVTDLALDE